MVEHPPYKWDKIVRFYHEVPSFVSVSKWSHANKVSSKDQVSKRLRVRCPTDRLSGIGIHDGVSAGSIPSDVPSPARVYYTGEWLL